MKIAIVQRGPDSVGKTTTIRMAYEMLRAKHPEVDPEYLRDNGKEILAILTISGVKIGIESLGDPWKLKDRLMPSMKRFVEEGCDVIVTATRTYGGTRDEVERLELSGYEIIPRDRKRRALPADQLSHNSIEARWIVKKIESLFAVVPA